MPYEDSNSRENVHGSYGHREFVNLTSDSTAENVFTNQELECKSYIMVFKLSLNKLFNGGIFIRCL